MKVHDIMISSPLTCSPHTNLAEVAHVMWTADCGIVPITDDTAKLIGVITDRDICIATSTQNKPPSAIQVNELPHGDVYTCRPDDDMRYALRQMRDHHVRRLPVVSADGILQGMLSIRDVIVSVGKKPELSAADLLETFKGICAREAALEQPAQQATATAGSRSN